MILSKRERRIAALTIMAVIFLALDRGLLTPYFRHRTQLTVEKQAILVNLSTAREWPYSSAKNCPRNGRKC